jgi:hypothetical protein
MKVSSIAKPCETKKDLHARMSALKDMSERNKQRAQRSAITQWSTCASVGEGRYRGASLRFGALHEGP